MSAVRTTSTHALGRLRERRVAGQVADAVVDVLEVVQVEDDQRELPLVAVGACTLARERLVEEATVVQPRQRVEVGELPRLAEPPCVLDRGAGAQRERLELPHVVVAEVMCPASA